MLEIRNLHVAIEDGTKKILNGLNLTIRDGEVAAIMGPNGSGKSTLSYVIAGKEDYEVLEGEILLDGKCRICLCPARSLTRYRIPRMFKSAIESGRLTILSSLPQSIRSNSASSSHQRNQLVADLADQIIVAHASEGSRTEEFALSLLDAGRVVDCLDVGCKRLVAGGARVSQIDLVKGRASE